MEGLKYAAEKYECIDLSRVAIHGWSYGEIFCTKLLCDVAPSLIRTRSNLEGPE